jgi:TonB family protein
MIASAARVLLVCSLCACGGGAPVASSTPPSAAAAAVTAPPTTRVSDEPVPVATGSDDQPDALGGLSAQQVLDTVTAARGPLQVCVETQLELHPTLAGTVRIEFTIAPDGHVRSASQLSSTLVNADAEKCLLAEVQSLRFPRAPDGQPTVVKFPFAFKPKSTK